ncbi:uncharacterized protein LOC123715551 isoform X1 [Pieris brassicae]|uniref:uncharacterized protein LOC123715551 isoform X1 n=2 Tax=Pieris brassicae TaxID=7116 RepID=UPI001E65ECE0|nr:uncharacterized protein LOC123715551 isoform X1 [Pieris brassicae]
MDDNSKNASSYQHDQEILDARGISMTVEEVAGLPTCKYTEKVQSLNLKDDDLMFLKGLRRRIRNRLASQNSRRRSVENLRRLTRELRAVRACRDDALSERRMLLATRTVLRTRYGALRTHILEDNGRPSDIFQQLAVRITFRPVFQKVLEERDDNAKVPDLDPEIVIESPKSDNYPSLKTQIFECRIDKLVQQSVNHIYKEKDAKTDYKSENVYKLKANDYMSDINSKIDKQIGCIRTNENYKENKKKDIDYKSEDNIMDRPIDGRNYKFENDYKIEMETDRIQKQEWKYKENDYSEDVINKVCAKTVFLDGVLNLSKKKSHGRKQTAPRRIAYTFSEPDSDGVLDLKIKKEPQ